MSDLRAQVNPYLRDDIDSVEVTIPQGLIRRLLEVNMIQKADIESLQARLTRLASPESFIDQSKYKRLDDYVDAELSARVEYARGNNYD